MLINFKKCSGFIQMFMNKNVKSYSIKKKKKETEKENRKRKKLLKPIKNINYTIPSRTFSKLGKLTDVF